jgi:hypothetical protein
VVNSPEDVIRYFDALAVAYAEAHDPHLVALVRAGATFGNGQLVERPGTVAA